MGMDLGVGIEERGQSVGWAGGKPPVVEVPRFGKPVLPVSLLEKPSVFGFVTPLLTRADPNTTLANAIKAYNVVKPLSDWLPKSIKSRLRAEWALMLRHTITPFRPPSAQYPRATRLYRALNEDNKRAVSYFWNRLRRDISYHSDQRVIPERMRYERTGFDKILFYDQYIDLNLQEVGQIAAAQVSYFRQRLNQVARQIDPKRPWQQIYEEEITHKAKPVASYKALHEAHMAAFKHVEAFVQQKGLFSETLPPGKYIYSTRDTRHFEFGERLNPGMMGNAHVLYLNRNTPADDYAEERMAQHVIQQLYPGTVFMRRQQDRLKQKITPTLQGALKHINKPFWLTQQGWNTYVLELMEEQGYFDHDPIEHLSVLRQLYRNAVLATAVKHYMNHEHPLNHVKAYISNSLYIDKADIGTTLDKIMRKPELYLFRVLGREMIYALREKVRQKEGDAFSLRSFHDRFIEGGALPIPIIAELQFGVTLSDDDVLRHVKQLEHRQRAAKEALEAQARKQAQPPNTPNASNASNSRPAGAGG
ncbi:MAG: DUF885 family protein [Cyanobacteria bacterium HKST-UBA06]|nr:DUF885 family protein [Cyanobacteria bacterium HKST-UBA06]